jgi:predicted outer membrane protein
MSEDPILAAKMLMEARKQIANSQLAVQRAETGDVRAFATAEVAEHQAIQSRLANRGFTFPTITPLPAPVAGAAPVDAVSGVPGNPPPAPVANRPVVPQPGTRPAANAVPPPEPVVTPAPPASPRAGTPIVNVGRLALSTGESRIILTEMQVVDQEIATFQREIGALTGITFDKSYVGNQLFAHYGLSDRVTIFLKHASPAMVQVLSEALPIIERHIATLKTLMARLEVNR